LSLCEPCCRESLTISSARLQPAANGRKKKRRRRGYRITQVRVTPHRRGLADAVSKGGKVIIHNILITMKKLIPVVLVAFALIGCDQQKTAIDNNADATKTAIDNRKEAVDVAAAAAKKQADVDATIEKAKIEADKVAAQAQLDANKKKADAQAELEKAKLDAEKK